MDRAEERLRQLDPAKSKIRESILTSVKNVTRNKRTMGMEELLNNINYPDQNLCHRCRTGFNIIGGTDETGVFDTKPLDQQTIGADPRRLPKLAKEHRAILRETIEDQQVDNLLKDLYEITTAESPAKLREVGRQAPSLKK